MVNTHKERLFYVGLLMLKLSYIFETNGKNFSQPLLFFKPFNLFFTMLTVSMTPSIAWSAAGDLDISFGTGGKVITAVGPARDVGSSVALQLDARILVAGWSDGADSAYLFALARYNTNGTPDNNFGKNGIVTTKIGALNSQIFSILVQSDGKIVAVGTTNTIKTDKDIAVVRYHSNGTLDTTFGVEGVTITSISPGADFTNSAALQRDGKIVVAAHFSNGKDNDIAVLRYMVDGTLDSKFGTGGIITTAISSSDDEAYGIVVQPDGKIVVAGSSRNAKNYYDFAVVRYNTDGTLDATFGTGGTLTTAITKRIDHTPDRDDQVSGVALQPDGKIVVVGYTYKDFAIVRYTTEGKLDETFHGNGILTTSVSPAKDEARYIVVQPDGKIVVVGKAIGSLGPDGTLGSSAMDIAVVRCNSDGTLDPAFGIGGHVTTAIGPNYDVAHSAAIQPDGKLVVAGYSKFASYDFAVLRYNLEAWNITPSSIAFVDETGIVTDSMESNTSIVVAGLGEGITVPISIAVGGQSPKVDNSAFLPKFGYIGKIRTVPTLQGNTASTDDVTTSAMISVGGLHAANNSSLILGTTVSSTYTFITTTPSFFRSKGSKVLLVLFGLFIIGCLFWVAKNWLSHRHKSMKNDSMQ